MLATAFHVGWWIILFWIFIGIAIGGLIAWLMGSSRTTTSQSLGVADFEGKTATVRTETTHSADQLEAIEGVGPQIAELFHKNGVHRFGQIAAMSPADISKMLAAGGSNFTIAQPFTWPFQAKLLENGWIAEFLTVGQKLTAGRLPVTGLAGVGEATAQRLSAADAGSVESLASADAAALAAKVSASGDSISESRLATFIAEAKKILNGDMTALAAFFGLPATVLSTRSTATYKETREVAGPVVNAQGLLGAVPAVAATSGGSLLPVWLGLGGAALLALLCMLKIICPAMPVVVEEEVAVVEPVVAPPAIPEGEGLIAQEENGKPMLIVFFATAKSDVTNELSTESAKLKTYLDEHPGSRLSVSGYVDPRGDAAFNAELSKNRAEKVAAALAAAGIAADRIDLDKPADVVANEATMANERKVEVKVKDAGQTASDVGTTVDPTATPETAAENATAK
ncbi:helix-hairpin-helix domain-containing protein [Sandaracinobacteroides hominis]|uniref:helix-hairpin-helix domain-containing protein n=1 Tax=Sandaracinobacteroides hominis TaxID=2780086 RepID=UPI0018F28F9D|nr:helix-hairpin-helix domain-containing protein [Sandaracinobacteroides hominis]